MMIWAVQFVSLIQYSALEMMVRAETGKDPWNGNFSLEEGDARFLGNCVRTMFFVYVWTTPSLMHAAQKTFVTRQTFETVGHMTLLN